MLPADGAAGSAPALSFGLQRQPGHISGCLLAPVSSKWEACLRGILDGSAKGESVMAAVRDLALVGGSLAGSGPGHSSAVSGAAGLHLKKRVSHTEAGQKPAGARAAALASHLEGLL